jgi:hypothetical protein
MIATENKEICGITRLEGERVEARVERKPAVIDEVAQEDIARGRR